MWHKNFNIFEKNCSRKFLAVNKIIKMFLSTFEKVDQNSMQNWINFVSISDQIEKLCQFLSFFHHFYHWCALIFDFSQRKKFFFFFSIRAIGNKFENCITWKIGVLGIKIPSRTWCGGNKAKRKPRRIETKKLPM